MRGIFCDTYARNNEEYRAVVKSRMRMWFAMLAAGMITFAAIFLAGQVLDVHISSRTLGFLYGVGTGLIFGASLLLAKSRALLKDEEKLKEERLKYSDERLAEIGKKAMITATKVLLMALYLIGLIGGMFYPVILKALFALIILFAAVYVISVKAYERRM